MSSDYQSPITFSYLTEGDTEEGWGIDLALIVTLRQGTLTTDGYNEMQAVVRLIASKELDTLENLQDQLEAEGKFIKRATS